MGQPVKQNAKPTPSTQKQGTSKLPRKVSAQLSNASDSASVTSSVKDQDNLEDLHDTEIDTVSVSTETSEQDGRALSQGHLQQDEIDAKVISPVEGPCMIMPPDILSETPYLSKHSVGIQVEDDSDLKTIQVLKEKGRHLHELVKQRTDLCWQLQDQIDEDSADFVAASVMILSVVHKVSCNAAVVTSFALLPPSDDHNIRSAVAIFVSDIIGTRFSDHCHQYHRHYHKHHHIIISIIVHCLIIILMQLNAI